jgi:hypothetical protein
VHDHGELAREGHLGLAHADARLAVGCIALNAHGQGEEMAVQPNVARVRRLIADARGGAKINLPG